MQRKGFTIWHTGLPAAGKSTIAQGVAARLREQGLNVEVLDGDVVRTNLSKGLGFSKQDRDTNIRRIAFVCHLLTRNGVVAIAAAVSPYREIRDEARELIGDFVEVFVDAPLEVCEARDPKGLYAQARAGAIKMFTGIDDPYEAPPHPEVTCRTAEETPEQSVARVMRRLGELGYVGLGSEAVAGERVTTGLVPPHGGKLVSRLVPVEERAERLRQAQTLPQVHLSSRELSDLVMIGMGAFSPLAGFLGEADYRASMKDLHLTDGTLWPIPITLAPADPTARSIAEGTQVALVDGESGEIRGTMLVQEKFTYDKRAEAQHVFRTEDEKHPGVAKVYAQGEICLGGPVEVLSEGQWPQRFPEYGRPAEVRRIFEKRGWRTVAAFQTRNPLHRSHEYLTKVALEICDGLFIHPLVGKLKRGDIPPEVRMRCYRVLLDGYYPADRVVLKAYPMEMRYAGPREAILHAIIRQNFGCSHMCVGRDHAGVGNYYGPFEAQEIFDRIPPGELELQPLKFEQVSWCYGCQAVVSAKTCPHDESQRLEISGTKLREMLAAGERPPPEFTRPEVLEVLLEYYASVERKP